MTTEVNLEEFDDEFADLALPTHTSSNNKNKRIGIEVDVTNIKGIRVVPHN